MHGSGGGYGTYASAQFTASRIAGARCIGFETGGHTWVGHQDAVVNAIVDIVFAAAKRRTAP